MVSYQQSTLPDPVAAPVVREQYQTRTGPVVTSTATRIVTQPNVVHLQINSNQKSLGEAYLLAVSLGFFGAHHFYLGRHVFGIVYFFTFGLMGLGYLIDLCRLPILVNEANKRLDKSTGPKTISLSDAYVLWLPPFGLLGFHQFYLRRYGWGIAYIFTLGFLGIGWLIDACRMKKLVDDLNNRIESTVPHGPESRKKGLCEAYTLTLFPVTGILGFQHYYLGRYEFGFLYSVTFGMFGVGWLADCLRMSCLVQHVNKYRMEGYCGKRRLDDCYLLWFPMGLVGLHHFYLNRPAWGVLYFFTFGCFGIGWLIDFCRIPFMVKAFNEQVELRQNLVNTVQNQYGSATTVMVTDNTMQKYLYPDLPPPYESAPQSNFIPGTFIYPPQGPNQVQQGSVPPGGYYNQAGPSSYYPDHGVNNPPPYQVDPPYPSKDISSNVQQTPPSAPPSQKS